MNSLRLMNYIKFKKDIIKIISQKYSTHPFKFIEIQDTWRRKDRVPKSWELIYRAPMNAMINWGTSYITITSSVCAAIGVYYGVFSSYRFDLDKPIYFGGSDIVIADNLQECLIYLGAYILFHVAVKIIISKYVLRLYKNGDQYLAIFRGNFYNSINKREFHLKDFKKDNPVFTLGWSDARYSLGKKKGIILQQHFRSPSHYNRLLYKEIKEDDY